MEPGLLTTVMGLVEIIGYVGRAISAKETPQEWSLPPYVLQALLLLLGPTMLAASIYMILSRLIGLLEAESYSLIRRKWLTRFFVTGDVVSFFAQAIGKNRIIKRASPSEALYHRLTRAVGGGKLANAKTKSDRNTGQTIIIAGLCIQVAFFGLFIAVTCLFHYRITKAPTTRSNSLAVPWRSFIKALYGASIFIMIRSIFRVIEYVMGKDGELQSKEVYLYVFDALLMFSVAVLFNVYHPSRIISKHKKLLTPISDSESQNEVYRLNRVDNDSGSHIPEGQQVRVSRY